MEEVHEGGSEFTVREHAATYGVGILILLIGAGLLFAELFFSIDKIPVWIYVTIALICLLGILFCAAVRNRQLLIEHTSFCYVNCIGQKILFSITDIGYVKAADHPEKGQDDLILYNKEGEKLCKLECGMKNAKKLLSYLHDRGILLDVDAAEDSALSAIVMQEQIKAEKTGKTADEVYKKTEKLVREWQEKNKKTGAKLEFGFAEYYKNKMNPELQFQEAESRCHISGEELPEDYLCVMELYVKKDGCYVQDKQSGLLSMKFPILYTKGESYKNGFVFYNKNYIKELTESLAVLEKYLPKHKFVFVREPISCELISEAGCRLEETGSII